MKTAVHVLKAKLASLSDRTTQISAATSVSLSFFTGGMVRAWTSPGVPSMNGDDDTFGNYSLSYAPLSREQISWISSLAPLGALIGSLLASFPLCRFGRKKTLLLSASLFLFSFVLLGTSSVSESLVAILTARGLMGFSVGLSMPAAQIYIAECSESSIRGTLGSFPALFMALGTVITYVVGAFLPWHFLSYFCASFPVLLLMSVAALPESPAWLLTHGREEEAAAALGWLRKGKDVSKELSRIRENIQRTSTNSSASDTPSLSPLLKRPVLVPLFISMSLMFFQQWCGVNAVIFYTVTIFKEAGSGIEKNLATVIVGIVQFLATFFSIFLVDKAGRRLLLLLSGLTMSMSLATVGAFFYLQEHNKHQGLDFLPLLGLILFMVGYSIGYASVPFVLMGELFPNRYRNLLGGISSSVNLTNTFLVIKLFTNIQTLAGLSGVFWIYAGVALSSCVFVLVCLPETKGKTLEEIEAHFSLKEHSQVLAKLAASPIFLQLPSEAPAQEKE